MGTYNSAVITNGGQSMIAQAVAGASLEFTTIKTSSYAYPAGTNLATLTTISGIKQSKDITGATVYNSRVIKISAAVDNTGISTAYTINTIGIYAKVGSAAEALFAVVTASAADTMPAYDSKPYSYIYEVNLTMQNAVNVTVTVNSAGLVNVSDLNAAKVEIEGEIDDLNSALSDSIYGLKQFMISAVPWVGYYLISGATVTLHGGDTQGTTSGWGIILVKVKKGKTINLSGFKNMYGTCSVWLNSANLSDINSFAWFSGENNGSHACVTDYLAISDHNTAEYISTMSVTYDYETGISDRLDNLVGEVYSGTTQSGQRFLHIFPATVVESGKTIKVRAELVSGTSTGLQIYYNNDYTNHFLANISYGIDYEFVLPEDMSQFDAYAIGNAADSVVNVSVTQIGTVGFMQQSIEDINNIEYSDAYSTSFTMQASTAHSSAIDKIKISLPLGSLFYLYIESSTGRIPAFMVNQYDSLGNATPNDKMSTSSVYNDKLLIESAADIDVESLGFFVTAPTETTTLTFYVIVKNRKSESLVSYAVEQNDINLKYDYQKDFLATLFKKPTFLISCDIHNQLYLFERINEFYKNNKTDYVFDKILLGDLVADRFEDTTKIMDTDFFKETLFVLGNHDVWLTSGDIASAKDSYDKYIAPNVGRWDVVQPADASTNGYCYYYKDYPTAYNGSTIGIRMIFLDEYHYDETQHTWFVSLLNSAVSNSLSVVVCTHQPQCTSSEISPLSTDYPFACPVGGYNLEPKESGYAGTYANAYINRRKAVDSFIEAGGKFICWMNGHTHRDDCGTFTETHGKQLNLTFINASQDQSSKVYVNAYSGDAFQYVAFDVSLGYVYIVRIGTPVDKWLHCNQYMVYDYINHRLVEYH